MCSSENVCKVKETTTNLQIVQMCSLTFRSVVVLCGISEVNPSSAGSEQFICCEAYEAVSGNAAFMSTVGRRGVASARLLGDMNQT